MYVCAYICMYMYICVYVYVYIYSFPTYTGNPLKEYILLLFSLPLSTVWSILWACTQCLLYSFLISNKAKEKPQHHEMPSSSFLRRHPGPGR